MQTTQKTDRRILQIVWRIREKFEAVCAMPH